ncbi:MAG: hypothetical protein VKI81_09640 [Synechococcaceae cyanobacterium]|nr:hypothetical protein [Synechococcaceae cyanobacterium]
MNDLFGSWRVRPGAISASVDVPFRIDGAPKNWETSEGGQIRCQSS